MTMQLDGPRWGPRQGVAAQLVVICHGVGADGHDLIDLAPHWAAALPHAAFVAPDGPERYDMVPPEMTTGRQWFSLADRTASVLEAGVAVASGILDAFIDLELLRLGLDSAAYAMVGFSQGAMTALYTGLSRTVPPRAILAYSGALLAPAAPVTAHPPVLLVHGEADEVVPVERSRLAEQALLSKGISVQTLYCPGLGHGIDEAGLSAGALFLQRAFAHSSRMTAR